jgi:hypothetical protein
MKFLILIFCLILCSCLSEGPIVSDANEEGWTEGPVVPDEDWMERLGEGACDGWLPGISVDEISFDAQGGTEYFATSVFLSVSPTTLNSGCYHVTYMNNGRRTFREVVCPWLTATKIDNYTLRISVSPNETEHERSLDMSITNGNCFDFFLITQPANYGNDGQDSIFNPNFPLRDKFGLKSFLKPFF